ncbi:response regulator [Terasakiella sp. SH-1]|uniref:response regulator n=1 Tax=Terasakiella sp. SH-1 TaxID=2560057 RepID=UPI00142FBA72|nr:response regulator [Terasakiella sp. SH-1]
MNNFDRNSHHIFIADDSETVRKMVSYVLGKAGYQVSCFEDGGELLTALRNLRGAPLPSVIILDYNMPNVDGFAACYQIKRNMAEIKTPIVFFTSMDHLENSALEAGADEFIIKPFQPEALLERIDYWAQHDTQWSIEQRHPPDDDRPLVMFADDSAHFRKMATLVIESAGFNVEAYEDGLELICNLEGKTPKVIVLDMEMPRA